MEGVAPCGSTAYGPQASTSRKHEGLEQGVDPTSSAMDKFGCVAGKAAMRTCRRAARAGPLVLLLVLSTLVASVGAVFIDFNNCLDPNIIHSEPRQLQFIPHFVSARFNTSDPSHNLNVTIYGNVSGQATQGTLPSPLNTTYWNNPNETFGKIVDLSTSNNKYTTLFSKFQVVTYTPYDAEPSRFCLATVNTSCPIAPVFEDVQDPYGLSIFTVAHDFYSSYAFASFAATIRVQSGDSGAPDLACISATITPDLGGALSDALRYLPAAILALVAVATIFAAIFSPWGSSDPFRWTSNYGRDEDLLRLVTPGFGDCLQYVQFIVLAGSLNLAYPGFYQPVISQAAWSTLLFNESFVTPGNSSYNSLVDGIYVTNSTYGLSRLGQLVGMDKDQDIWAAFAVWFLGITVAAVLLCQIGFVIKWAYRFISHTQEEDLRSKNLPFSTGVVVRMTFNYFLLPIVSISLFQLVVASRSPASVVAMAVFLLIVVIGLAAWIFRLIFTTKPRAHLFDDLPTVLTYGPLYNTYSDDAAPFAFIPVLLTFIRGVAIGAIQPSGIAQLIILAICEVIYILTLHAFRPFQAPTSMNAYHTFFSVVRLLTTLLSVAFVPNLDVAESSKGWLGYAILLLHAIVLVFGFFLNSIQTIVEVSARMAGAGDARGGLTKVFGKRQLSRRTHRRGQRSSLNSNAGMLGDGDSKSIQLMGGRSRSLSASSAVLLARQAGMDGRMSGGFEHFSQGGDPSNYGGTSPEPGTPGGSATPYTFLPSGSASAGASSRRPTMGTMAPKGLETTDPYYRPPRARRQTVDPYTPGARSRASWGNGDSSKAYEDAPESGDAGEGSSFSPHRGSITPAYLRGLRDDSDPNINEPRRPRTDYAVRESDFYYGVTRGPALASDGVPTRKLKTGPADPMGPMSSAGGWLKSLFGAKRKDKSKGFEVVRSTRAPQMLAVGEEEENAPDDHHHEPYQDNPDPRAHPDPPRAMSAYTRASSEDGRHPDPPRAMSAYTMASSDDGHIARPRRDSSDSSDSQESSEEENLIGEDGDIFHSGGPRVSDMAPTLGPIETGGGIELPSRIGSKASSKVSRMGSLSRPPTIPRKSSKRQSGHEATMFADTPRLSTISASPSEYATQEPPAAQEQHASGYLQPGAVPRLPFGSSKSSPSPERSAASSIGGEAGHSGSMRRHTGSQSTEGERPLSTGYVHQHKASESIQPGLYDPAVHMGSRAEFVQDPLGSRSTRRSEE